MKSHVFLLFAVILVFPAQAEMKRKIIIKNDTDMPIDSGTITEVDKTEHDVGNIPAKSSKTFDATDWWNPPFGYLSFNVTIGGNKVGTSSRQGCVRNCQWRVYEKDNQLKYEFSSLLD